jgi:hypothetical protein
MAGSMGVFGSCSLIDIVFLGSHSKSNGGAVYANNELAGTCVFSDLTFQNAIADLSGGGIYAQSGQFLMDHIYGRQTSAVSGSGGFMYHEIGSLIGSVFSVNSTSAKLDGGLFWLDKVDASFSTATFSDLSAGGDGGAFYISAFANFSISDADTSAATAGGNGGCILSLTPLFVITTAQFTHCSAALNGGALYVNVSSLGRRSSSTVFLTSVSLSHNVAALNGGGLYTSNALSTITNVTFYNNIVDASGGGFYSILGAPIFSQCLFLQNNAKLDGAGGYWSQCMAVFSAGTPFTSNTALRNGGGFYQQSGGVALNNFFISNNRATQSGGGFYIQSGNLDIQTILLSGNDATNGGSFYILNGTSATQNMTCRQSVATFGGCGYVMGGQHSFNVSSISQSNATNSGGGLYFGGGVSVFENVTFTQLQALHGAAGYFANAQLSFSDLLVTWNVAAGDGGGFYYHDSNSYITSAMFLNLTASTGGALYISEGSDVLISESIFEFNSANVGGAISVSNATLGLVNCFIDSNVAALSGAAIDFEGGATSLFNVSIFRNGCPAPGGSVINGNRGSLSGTNVGLWDDVAPFGGFGHFISANVSFDSSFFSCDPFVSRSPTLIGGAIYSQNSPLLRFTNSLVTNCTATQGGAYYIQGGNTYFENITLHGHVSSGNGGALYVSNGVHTIYHTLITQNNATNAGGAIYYNGVGGGFLLLAESNITQNNGGDPQGQDVYVDSGYLRFSSSWLTSTTPPITNWTSCNTTVLDVTGNSTYNTTVYGRSIMRTIWDTCPTFVADNPLDPHFNHLHRVVQMCVAPLYEQDAHNEGYNGWRQESSSLYMNNGMLETLPSTLLGKIDRIVLTGQIRGEWKGDFAVRDLILSSGVAIFPGAITTSSQPDYINGDSLTQNNPGTVIFDPPDVIPVVGDFNAYSQSGGISYISQNLTVANGGSFVMTGQLILQVGATAELSGEAQVGASSRFRIEMEAYVLGDKYIFGFPVELAGNISAGLRAPASCNYSMCPIPVNGNGTQVDLYNSNSQSYLYGGVMQVVGDFHILSTGTVRVDLWMNSSTNPTCNAPSCFRRRRQWVEASNYDAVGHDVITATGEFVFNGRLEVVRYGGFRYSANDLLTSDRLPPIGSIFTPFWYGSRGYNLSDSTELSIFCTNVSRPAIDPIYTNKFMKFYASAPKIANICLRDDLVTLQLTFDRPTDEGRVETNFFDCGMIFRNDTVDRINGIVTPVAKCITGKTGEITEKESQDTFYQSNGLCSFTDPTLLAVIKGSGSDLNVGDIMYINPDTPLRGLDTDGDPFTLNQPGFNFYTDGFLIITSCTELPNPVAVIQGPQRIGACDVL